MHYLPRSTTKLLPVSHDTELTKRVFLSKGQAPHILQIAESSLQPGQSITEHAHPDATEVFYVTAGSVDFVVNLQRYSLGAGDVLVIEKGDLHYLENVSDAATRFFYVLLTSEGSQ